MNLILWVRATVAVTMFGLDWVTVSSVMSLTICTAIDNHSPIIVQPILIQNKSKYRVYNCNGNGNLLVLLLRKDIMI